MVFKFVGQPVDDAPKLTVLNLNSLKSTSSKNTQAIGNRQNASTTLIVEFDLFLDVCQSFSPADMSRSTIQEKKVMGTG